MLKILTFSTLFPNSIEPHHGIFTETTLRQQLASKKAEAVVVAPVPWFPFRSRRFGRYARYAQVPKVETRNGIRAFHPRYVNLPGIGMHFAPLAIANAAQPVLEDLIASGYDFDVIDAHYFYPDGVAAAILGRRLDKPVVISALGSDINLLPDYALPRCMIRWAARHAVAMISVCAALKRKMVGLGIDAEHIHTLRNGVDLELFYPAPREAARASLGLDSFTLLSVGHLVTHKGHHRAIGALTKLSDVILLIVGAGPEHSRLVQLARNLGVEDRVRFIGVLSQNELRSYYSAADALVLASDREGWANVLLESMACGTPVLASDVGGTAEVVSCHAAGRMLPSNCPLGVAEAVRALRSDSPDREATRAYAECFSWNDTTKAQLALFSKAANAYSATDESYVPAR